MKKTTIILFLILLLSGYFFNLKAQVIKGALIAGFNMTQVDGDEVYGFKKIGFNVGAAAIIPVKKKWSISLETIFSQKGAYQRPQYNDTLYTGEYNLRLNYVEVPVLVHFTEKNLFSVGTGFSWGRLVKSKEIEHGGIQPPYSDSVAFNRNDFNWLIDIRFRVWKKLKFNIRYAYSLAKIRTREFYSLAGTTWTRKQYNNVLTFRLIYVFNEQVEYVKKKNK
jgi:hypothetical protein